MTLWLWIRFVIVLIGVLTTAHVTYRSIKYVAAYNTYYLNAGRNTREEDRKLMHGSEVSIGICAPLCILFLIEFIGLCIDIL